jgi:hypothetical protein
VFLNVTGGSLSELIILILLCFIIHEINIDLNQEVRYEWKSEFVDFEDTECSLGTMILRQKSHNTALIALYFPFVWSQRQNAIDLTEVLTIIRKHS